MCVADSNVAIYQKFNTVQVFVDAFNNHHRFISRPQLIYKKGPQYLIAYKRRFYIKFNYNNLFYFETGVRGSQHSLAICRLGACERACQPSTAWYKLSFSLILTEISFQY